MYIKQGRPGGSGAGAAAGGGILGKPGKGFVRMTLMSSWALLWSAML